MADPEGNAIKTMAMAIAIRAAAMWGPCLVPKLPLSAFSGDDVVLPVAGVVVEPEAAGVAAVEAFVKIAASGELGDKPRSSVYGHCHNAKLENQ